MSNYIGYFRSVHNDILYSVKITSDIDSSTPIEITLSGDEPFVVKYNDSDTPFDPIRNSTATIKIISDNYFENILPSKAKERKVLLTNENNGTVVWCGYLTPKIYDMGYTECNEEIELEASDCISVLQYLDYEPLNNKGIVTFKQIMDKLCDVTELLDGYNVTISKKLNESRSLKLSDLEISERNFYSSDMEDVWSYQDILKEICTYLGYTAIQWGDRLYLMDYTIFNNSNTYTMFSYSYPKDGNYYEYMSRGTAPYTITDKDIMGNDSSISFEPIYNKIYVNCNMFTCDDFIPNIFDDKHLKNRNGEFYKAIEIDPETPNTAEYRYGNKNVAEKVSDADYKYFHRLYDNEYWDSVYQTEKFEPITKIEYDVDNDTTYITKDYIGGTLLDLGTVKKTYFDKEVWGYVVANKLDYERYLCISQMGKEFLGFNYDVEDMLDKNYSDKYTVYKLKSGFKSQCIVGKNAYLVIDYKYLVQRYRGRNYINPDWAKVICKGKNKTYAIQRPTMVFQLKIGDKYWNGDKWVIDPHIFTIQCSKALDADNMFNTEFGIANTVEYDMFINEEGYKIPLKNVDKKAEIEFRILLPVVGNFILNKDDSLNSEWNNYCWVKDFSIKVVEPNQDIEKEENDIVYENVIDEDNINKLDEITLKITTQTRATKPSYSNVGLIDSDNVFLWYVIQEGLSGVNQKPEENIIEKYYSQYSTPTKKISLTVGNNLDPFQKIYGVDVDNPSTGYVVLGSEIDYLYDKQTITLIEKK